MKISSRKLITIASLLLIASGIPAGALAATESRAALPPSVQQTVEVKGKVIDKAGNPIPGATISVKGSSKGTSALSDGSFSIKVGPNDKVFIISFVGMKSTEVTAPRNSTPITITLEDNAQMIEDVIITGYGTFKKSAYAGSASSVKTEALKDVPTTNLSQMLQGVTSGITLSGSSNQPGSAAQIRVRGMGSFNASNNPLYVIDGVPVTSGNVSMLGSNGGLDIMSTINPSDIESITVIKDAAAASLYGSRAANGVILIKTKSGKDGKSSFSFKSDWGFSDFATSYRKPMGGEERRSVIYEGLINKATIQDGLDAEKAKAFADSKIDEYAPKPWNGWADWTDLLFRKGFHQNYEVSATGGTDKVKYYTSLGYNNSEGVSFQSKLERISGRLNVSYKMTPKMELGANVLFSEVQQEVSGEGSSYTSPLYSSRNTVTPSNAAYNEDGSYASDFPRNGDRNPKSTADLNYDKEWINRALNTVYGSYDFTSNLKFKTTYTYDFSVSKGRSWRDPRTSDGAKDNGKTEKVYSDRKYWVWTNILSYEKTFNDKHNVDAVVGYEVDSKFRDELSGVKKNFPSINDNDIDNGSIPYAVGGYYVQTRMVSYISKLNYNYSNKYYLGASFRRDGSSKLASKNRWGNFWSVSGAWRISGEDFMRPFNDIVTDMKVRASYGVNATLPSEYYGYLNLTSYGNDYDGEPGIAESQIAYDKLTWESNYNINLGVDFELFNRINVTAEWYQRKTKDLLIDKPLTLTSGFPTILTNEGKMLNRGIEVDIKTTNIQQKDLTWTTSINLSHNRNEILRLDGVQQQIPSGSQIRKVGYPYHTFYLREFAGINPENGMPQFYTNNIDANGKQVKDITEDPSKANPIVGKSASPKLTGGISNYLNYKFIDLGFTFTYSLGGYSYDNAAQKLEHSGSEPDANIPTYYRDRWKKKGDNAKYEVFIVDNKMAMSDWSSDRRVHSTDHLRLKNFTLGATLPSRWAKMANLTKARVFFSASNLLTWAAYNDYDPEVTESGSVYFELTPLKKLTFGIELNF